MYNSAMDVAVSDLRANLSSWLERARAGEDVVVTERGVPVARLVGIGEPGLLERLTKEGVIGRPRVTRRPKASPAKRVAAQGSVSDYISEQRR
jgi:prevent-host-death family protein